MALNKSSPQLLDPSVFAIPEDVRDHTKLTSDEKIDVRTARTPATPVDDAMAVR